MSIVTLKKYTHSDGLAGGWKVFVGDNFIGAIRNPAPLDWRGEASDGTSFGARSKPKIIQILRIHAAGSKGTMKS